MVQIEMVLSGKPYSEAYKIWDVLASNYEQEFAEVKVVDGFSGKEINFVDVSEYLLKKKADSFFIELNEGRIEFSYISDLDFSRLDIKNLASSKESAEEWVSQMLNEPSFVQATN